MISTKTPPNSGRYPNTAGQQRTRLQLSSQEPPVCCNWALLRVAPHPRPAPSYPPPIPPDGPSRSALRILKACPAHADPPSRSPAQTLLCPPYSILHCLPRQLPNLAGCWSRGPLDLTRSPWTLLGSPATLCTFPVRMIHRGPKSVNRTDIALPLREEQSPILDKGVTA